MISIPCIDPTSSGQCLEALWGGGMQKKSHVILEGLQGGPIIRALEQEL